MKAHIFLIANPKFQLQILCSFGDITKSVKFNGIPENNFLCIFIIASSSGVHTFFCLWRVTRSYLGVKLQKCISEVKVNQLKVKNMHVKMGISTFNKILCTKDTFILSKDHNWSKKTPFCYVSKSSQAHSSNVVNTLRRCGG